MPRTTLLVNGTSRVVDVDPDDALLFVLREALGLTGAKYGCGEGQCGACTVLVGGRAVRSCVTKAATIKEPITTIEGLETDGVLHPVQQAFVDREALQCGYCTPGMIMSAVALLKSTPRPTRERIVAAMNGNVCRCGVYPRIVDAILAASGSTTPETESRP
jgi:aerobic-type carbon monoxide dehydrogenase small subunit (CoxS/CutS family)